MVFTSPQLKGEDVRMQVPGQLPVALHRLLCAVLFGVAFHPVVDELAKGALCESGWRSAGKFGKLLDQRIIRFPFEGEPALCEAPPFSFRVPWQVDLVGPPALPPVD